MGRAIRLLTILLLALAGPLATATTDAAPIAAGGFGRPQRLDAIPSGADARVAVATSAEGPLVVWEGEEGVTIRPVEGPGEATRATATQGVRDVAAGGAGGDPVVAWTERDLRTGRHRLAWRWRGETRTVLESGERPLLRLVAGSERPELLLARPGPGGWRLSLHGWDGGVRTTAPRERTVAGVDALRVGDAVIVAWLEGTNEVTLGTVERDWTAWSARWPDGAATPEPPTALGPAVRIGTGDVVRLARAGDDVHALWPGPDGGLRATGPGGPIEGLGPGSPLGWLDGAWTWAAGTGVHRFAPGDEAPQRVLRLPAAPERVEAAEAAGVVAIAWSSGRFEGGVEVWAASDAEPYAARPIERLALRMGWDPWRPWSAAAGHLVLTVLAAVGSAAVLTPAWWLGTAALGRRAAVGPGTAALEGAAVAVGTILALAALAAWRTTLDPARLRTLLGGPLLLAAAASLGLAAAWFAGRRRDAEPSFARLVAAWIAGGTMLLVLAFATIQGWLDLFDASP